MSVPDLHRPAGAVTALAEDAQGRLCRSADPFWTDPGLEDVKQGLARIESLLERLVVLEEERREGERQLEALERLLVGGEEPAAEMTDHELLAAFYRNPDGSYGIALGTGTRPATPEEAQRLEQLVGRRTRRNR